MSLSNELISQFVKVTVDGKNATRESTVHGTVRVVGSDGATTYVLIDGATELVNLRTTTKVSPGDRVLISIKDRTAVVIGNLTAPSINSSSLTPGEGDQITELDILLADKVSTAQLAAEVARIKNLETSSLEVRGELDAAEGYISELQADNVDIKERLTAAEGEISHLEVEKLSVEVAEATYASIEDLEATEADIYNLEATHAEFEEATAKNFEATNANIEELDTTKLDAEQAKVTYANIDFSNIGKAAMEYFYATSGLIESVIVGDGTITGRLVGVTLSGDLIEGNTIKAEKLVIKGSDGLYYKLNTDGITTEAEQTDENSLNGSIIKAKSITASKISVTDLVAFGATIGGFNITDSAIYSEVKDSEGNTTRGIYLDKEGNFDFGDETNFVKYYQDADGNYRLAISADSILYALNGKQYSISDLGRIGEYINIGTYEGEPCIELGESDSDFKLLITNTRIMFKEGTNVPAYFNNQSMHIKKAVIEEELQQGGFVWKVRQNGNMGLVWKGGV